MSFPSYVTFLGGRVAVAGVSVCATIANDGQS